MSSRASRLFLVGCCVCLVLANLFRTSALSKQFNIVSCSLFQKEDDSPLSAVSVTSTLSKRTNTTTTVSSSSASIIDNHQTHEISERVGIVIVSDKNYQKVQEPLYQKIRSYAATHGYDLFIVEPTPTCRHLYHNFFFQKHCTVRELLSKQEFGYTLFVLDGDVICVAPNVSLSRWIQIKADVLLYERDWNFEIMAGNYMVRHTNFGLAFLYVWEQYEYKARFIRGFHSSDNGAIHLVVLQVLLLMNDDGASSIPSVQRYVECDRLYQNLTGTDVQHLDEYYAFVACTRRALGPNRQWSSTATRGSSGTTIKTLTILHRYHGFAIDGIIGQRKPGGGIPFYHGEKDPPEAIRHYETIASPWKSAAEQSMAMKAAEAQHWVASKGTAFSQVPRINLASCLYNFSCRVATASSSTVRNYYQEHSTTVVFDYEDVYAST